MLVFLHHEFEVVCILYLLLNLDLHFIVFIRQELESFQMVLLRFGQSAILLPQFGQVVGNLDLRVNLISRDVIIVLGYFRFQTFS